MERFVLIKKEESWLCIDMENEMSCEFAPHKLNETQKFQFLRENMDTNVMAVARWCREMGDWLSANHYDKVF
ncbi:MAG: hypothetical protein LBS69_07835 [Prevotellaceae bacterium]|jgi:hypothetical protein|nr:hypothetical protein [Prevotellaceae bacterium]